MKTTKPNQQTAESKVEVLTDVLSEQELRYYKEIADELCRKYNVSKVHVYIGIEPDTNDRVVGYLKEPSYAQKVYSMDKIASVGMFQAGDELRQALTLKDESDPRTYNEGTECDMYRLGMASTCVPIIQVIANQFKKK